MCVHTVTVLSCQAQPGPTFPTQPAAQIAQVGARRKCTAHTSVAARKYVDADTLGCWRRSPVNDVLVGGCVRSHSCCVCPETHRGFATMYRQPTVLLRSRVCVYCTHSTPHHDPRTRTPRTLAARTCTGAHMLQIRSYAIGYRTTRLAGCTMPAARESTHTSAPRR